MWPAEVVAEERSYLFAIAYRLLGSASDADDAVQQAFLQSRDAADVRSARAFLTTVVTRICLDELGSARRRRLSYVGPWLPEPILTGEPPADPVENAESLSTAFLLLLETLSPLERAVWVLREAFDRDTDEIAQALDKKEDAVRQLLSRARDKIATGKRRRAAPRDAQQSLAIAFFSAAQTGDLEALVSMLRADVVLSSDHGGKAKAIQKPLSGADHVARYFIGMAQKGGRSGVAPRMVWLNGGLGLLVYEEGKLTTSMSFDIDLGQDGAARIARVHVMRNPDKLARLERAAG